MTNSVIVPSLWDDAKAATLDEPGLLLYRSNLLYGEQAYYDEEKNHYAKTN